MRLYRIHRCDMCRKLIPKNKNLITIRWQRGNQPHQLYERTVKENQKVIYLHEACADKASPNLHLARKMRTV